MGQKNILDRYKVENENIIIEVSVKNSRQLFNDHDPAPFRERDLDPRFVTYIVSAVEEFPLRTQMIIRVLTSDAADTTAENRLTIRESIQKYFEYESELAKAKLRKRNRTARNFFMIGLATLFVCLTLAQFVSSIHLTPALADIVSVGLIIIGWVAMWHPVESLLYDWWPIREQRLYFDKLAHLNVEVVLAIVP